jgi:predicted lipoprotein with Yx(FWY)xxD motif
MLLRRFLLPLLLSLTVAAGLTTGVVATSHATGPAANSTVTVDKKSQPPVKVVRVSGFGRILVTARGFALYNFTPERNGAIKCTGGCAKVWPPLLLPKGAAPPRAVRGAAGTFGVVVRPEGKRQLTYRRRPLYTYVDDKKPGQVLCDGVNGWFAVRVSVH